MDSAALGGYLPQVCTIAREAGAIIASYYAGHSARVRYKEDRSPVTDADLAANDAITAGLQKLTPQWPVVSEETFTEAPPGARELVAAPYYWLVDPLDGTKEFIAGSDEFTVNIALISQQRPLLGVVYLPIQKIMYYASQGAGSFKQAGAQAQRIHSRRFNEEDFIYVVSRHHDQQNLAARQSLWPGCRVRQVGSSLKFCLLAEGQADLYLRYGPTNEWDTAAAHCILEEAGGKLVTLQNAPLLYNKARPENPEFIACGDRDYDITRFQFGAQRK